MMLKTIATLNFLLILLGIVAVQSCTHKPQLPIAASKYPKEIGTIFLTKCATAGCHNATTASGGIRMDEWQYLFEGGNNGAVVIPYRPDISSLMYYINTDESKGPVAQPTMPLNAPHLTEAEVNTIRNWIASGAPDAQGNIPFADKAETRQKLYLSQQACDEIAVIDMAKKVVMRSIKIGQMPAIENPHTIRADAQGKYLYVCLAGGTVVQKIDMKTDVLIAEANIGAGKWNAMYVAPDGKHLLVSDWSGQGQIVKVNTTTMTEVARYSTDLYNKMNVPHGIAANASFDTFFATRQTGNSIIKFSGPAPYQKLISLDGLPPQATNATLDPHELIFAPNYTRYFVSCEKANEVRVMDAYADTLIKTIPVGIKPQEFAMAKSLPYLFVSCSEDNNPNPLSKGSVYVINYNTLQVVAVIYERLYQPHGLTLDEQSGLLMVASRNYDGSGPAPHHASSCAGRNGYYTFYDMATFQPFKGGKKFEVLPDPYSADTRFR